MKLKCLLKTVIFKLCAVFRSINMEALRLSCFCTGSNTEVINAIKREEKKN